jgi:hypothetical protein
LLIVVVSLLTRARIVCGSGDDRLSETVDNARALITSAMTTARANRTVIDTMLEANACACANARVRIIF